MKKPFTRFERNVVNEKKAVVDDFDLVSAFARTTYKSIYITNNQKKSFEYVSENPLFLCGHSAQEVRQMGYDFYLKHVPASDQVLLLSIKRLAYLFYNNIPLEERILYSITYDYHLTNAQNIPMLVHEAVTPLTVNKEGILEQAICTVSISTAQNAGNATIFKAGGQQLWRYNYTTSCWEATLKPTLSQREIEIIRYTARGYTIAAIATLLHISPDTIKFHRKKLFEKLQVNTATEAIRVAIINKLI